MSRPQPLRFCSSTVLPTGPSHTTCAHAAAGTRGIQHDLSPVSGHICCKVLPVLSHLFGLVWLRLREIELLYHRNVDVLLKSTSGCMFCQPVFRAVHLPPEFLCLHVSCILPPRITHNWGAPSTRDHALG